MKIGDNVIVRKSVNIHRDKWGLMGFIKELHANGIVLIRVGDLLYHINKINLAVVKEFYESGITVTCDVEEEDKIRWLSPLTDSFSLFKRIEINPWASP